MYIAKITTRLITFDVTLILSSDAVVGMLPFDVVLQMRQFRRIFCRLRAVSGYTFELLLQ